MNNKKKLISMFLVVVALAAMVLAVAHTLNPTTLIGGSLNPTTGQNVSGSINLSAQVLDNQSVANIYFMWQLTSNYSVMANVSTTNRSGYPIANPGYNTINETFFNTTFDTTSLPDGVYNLTLLIYNGTSYSNTTVGIVVVNQSHLVNESASITVTVDNTVPVVTINEPATSGVTYDISSYNITFNASISDLTIQTVVNTAAVSLVLFEFDNATGNAFNFSNNQAAINQSGYWSMSINVSALHAGTHIVTVHANDTVGNSNRTQTWTFDVNTPHNVTWMTTDNLALGFNTGVLLFNLSIINSTSAPINTVVFMFDNASKSTQMNVTNTSNAQAGQYWNISLNISTFPVGTHTVTAFVNDTVGNLNKTELITFTVNNTAQNVTWFEDVTTPVGGQNFSGNNGTIYFNVSILNSTAYPITNVIFMFDNASGNNFNVTNTSAPIGGQYYNLSYINVSNLTEGAHTVTIFVNNSLGHINKTESITFVVDKTGPSVSVTCTDSPTVGSTVSCTCSTSDDRGVPIQTFDEESTIAGSVGTYSSSACSASDGVGNEASATGSYTVVAASSGTGSGGSSGGSTSAAAGQFAKEVWASINAGETATVEVENGEIGVTEVSFAVEDTTYGAWVKVEKVSSLPKSVKSFTKKKYKDIKITESNVKKALKGNVDIDFIVTKVWLSEQGLGKTDVAMFRYVDEKWVELKTTVGIDDGTYVYYSAETPGFSYFVIGQKTGVVAGPGAEEAAVVGEEAAEEAAEETVAEEAAEETVAEEAMAEEAAKPAWPWVVVILVILAIIVVAYWLKSRK